MRKTLILTLLASILLIAPAVAQEPKNVDRKEWFKELRRYKHEFLVKELQLSKEQQEKFFPIYDEMENSVENVNRETRALERKIDKAKDSKVSDLEYEKAAEALFEVKSKESAIEMQYLPKFKKVLTPKQLFELKKAERKFTYHLMKEHSKAKASKK